MRVSPPHIEEVGSNGRVRLVADVAYDRADHERETYWFEFPAEVRDDISVSGNPWLVCLIPLAVTLGEPLRIDAPVDSTLLANIDELMHVWKSWYPPLAPVDILVESHDEDDLLHPRRTAAFFSGGVDAFFTALRHDDPDHLRHPKPVDDLLTIWGFDIPLDRPDEFTSMHESLRSVATKLDKELIDIGTNIRSTRWREAHWGKLAHGCGLGSIGLALERRFQNVMIGSGSGYVFLQPWGSHYVTDPLLSTSRLTVSHDGSAYDRSAKTEYIASNDVVRRSLRVCWKHRSAANCSECGKCLRTMLTLEAMGELDQFPVFAKISNVKDLPRLYVKSDVDAWHLRRISAYASEKGREDIRKYIDESLSHSKRIAPWLQFTSRVERTRFARIGHHLRRRALSGLIK